MKYFTFTTLFFLLSLPTLLKGQEKEPRAHQLSLNLLSVRQNQPIAFLYQYHLEKGSLRFGLSGNLASSDSEGDDTDLVDNTFLRYNLGLRGGWAFHKMVREFDLYYGADAVIRYWHDERNQNQQQVDNDFLIQNRVRNLSRGTGLAIEPFLGLNYAVNEMLSLGIELRSSIGYSLGVHESFRERNWINLLTNDVQTNTMEEGPVQTNNLDLSLINFYGVWLSIHL